MDMEHRYDKHPLYRFIEAFFSEDRAHALLPDKTSRRPSVPAWLLQRDTLVAFSAGIIIRRVVNLEVFIYLDVYFESHWSFIAPYRISSVAADLIGTSLERIDWRLSTFPLLNFLRFLVADTTQVKSAGGNESFALLFNIS